MRVKEGFTVPSIERDLNSVFSSQSSFKSLCSCFTCGDEKMSAMIAIRSKCVEGLLSWIARRTHFKWVRKAQVIHNSSQKPFCSPGCIQVQPGDGQLRVNLFLDEMKFIWLPFILRTVGQAICCCSCHHKGCHTCFIPDSMMEASGHTPQMATLGLATNCATNCATIENVYIVFLRLDNDPDLRCTLHNHRRFSYN